MTDSINILISSKHEKEREYLASVLSEQDNFIIAGVEKDETGAIIKSERLKPDVFVMDLSQPESSQPELQPKLHQSGLDGPELARMIHRRSPSTSIIMICDRDENDYAGSALKAGVSGYLLRKTDMNKLIPAVKIVNLGGYFVTASIVIRALDTITLAKTFPSQIMNSQVINMKKLDFSLSTTERSIITFIAQGYSDEEIAGYLNISSGTVKNCLTLIKRKTNLKNRVQIVLFSLVSGLIDHIDLLKMIDNLAMIQ
jgi:DNA-binding NarL/FixJ family response regulator